MYINFNQEPYIVINNLIDLYIILKREFNINLNFEESLVQKKIMLDRNTEFDLKLLHQSEEELS